jgi:hypothetical protein
MAIVFWEGFEWAQTGNLLLRADEVTSQTGTYVAIVSGIDGMLGNCLRLRHQDGFFADYVSFPLNANYTSGLLSFAARFQSSATNSNSQFMRICSGGYPAIIMRLNINQTVSVMRYGTPVVTTAVPVPLNKRIRFELSFAIHASTGTIELRVIDGTTLLTTATFTGVQSNPVRMRLVVACSGLLLR